MFRTRYGWYLIIYKQPAMPPTSTLLLGLHVTTLNQPIHSHTLQLKQNTQIPLEFCHFQYTLSLSLSPFTLLELFKPAMEAEKPKPPADKTVDIDRNGDVIFLVGDEKRRFRVSSSVLTSTSTVFKKMFGPDFLEGQTLQKYKHVEVPLPEDDPESMLIILYVLHWRNSSVPVTLPSKQIRSIAILSDKYDLNIPMKLAVHQWLNQNPPVTDPKELWVLTNVAYAFQDEIAFATITSAFILHYARSYGTFGVDEELNPDAAARICCMYFRFQHYVHTACSKRA